MDASKLSFTSDAYGYMLTYRGENLGGAGVKERKALHWKHRRDNLRMFAQDARREIALLTDGRGQPRFLQAIERIDARVRLEYLRGELRAERISYGELAELQSLASHIPADDLELREAAGLPEHDDDDESEGS